MTETDTDTEERSRTDGMRLDEALRQRLEGLIPEVVKRTFYAGLGAVFTTEEGIRRLTNEFSLPKDVAAYLVQQAQSTKNEFLRIVAEEVRKFLENMNINEELLRLLTSLSFEVKTEIRFVPNQQKLVRPKVKNRLKVRRQKKDEATEDEPPETADDGPEVG